MPMAGPVVLERDLERCRCGDPRLRRRAGRLVRQIAEGPDRGLPRLLDEKDLEAAYRFVNNPRVTLEGLLDGHHAGLRERAKGLSEALAIHDTTAFVFGGSVPREGLGIDNQGRGFSGHFAILATSDGLSRPLGVGGIEALFRYKRQQSERRQRERYLAKDKESLRWIRMVDATEAKFGLELDLIHLMDSEADWYDLLDHLVLASHRFIVRLTHPRVLLDERGRRLKSSPIELLERAAAVARREVALSPRTNAGKAPSKNPKKNGPRKARVAKLEIAARSVTIARPQNSVAASPSITINLVHVREVDCPAGAEPVDWLLGTTESIDRREHVLTVVDHYRARWLIEDYFKALKTGCAYEKRQFESKAALLNLLGLLAPIAWMLLAFRSAAEEQDKPTDAGERLLTVRQLTVLRAALIKRAGRDVLAKRPTERDVALGVARLGGYVNKSRPPGWLVLGRGMEDLLVMEAGWALARGEPL